MEIEYREFVRHAGKYLDGEERIIKGRKGTWRISKIELKPLTSTYSCGCKREVFFICPKCGVK